MSIRYRLSAVSIFVVIAFLAGCAGHYKFSDDEYRSLGDPGSLSRGKSL